ncbi:DUF3443 domain-containing protein [Burkholderia cenocepacia]|uniref:DUF3443 domain-containing protein n=2 Tax=Burkholderia cenocepacia TaxID=95486 RepID=UPI001CF4968A|nr:DUF3443 domain-containing protein [Burkholderia cenocepacia]MCA7963640.1 DUF3443 domain-containing protein [Burkholderia cenocepacia]
MKMIMSIFRTVVRWFGIFSLMIVSTAFLVACGGGDSGSGETGASSSGTSDGNTGNTAIITVARGVARVVNIPTVNIKICAPGTSSCQVVSNVLVDTASYGLRIVRDAIPSVIDSLPKTTTSDGATLSECGKFVSSYTWGTVRTIDLAIGDERARSLPVQIIGDLGTDNVPSSCTNGNESANSATALGANGILGIGPAPYDCGAPCVKVASLSNYYACADGNSSCEQVTVPLSQQISNPVGQFAVDNNGVIVQMPQISEDGRESATGSLIFGIGTQSNNAFGATTKLMSTTTGDVPGAFLSRKVTAFFDTGSNANFFDDSSQITCTRNTRFYCPSTTTTYAATLVGLDGTVSMISLSVANADTLFSRSSTYAFNDVAGHFGSSSWLDLGLPYFYGRTIYFGLDRSAEGGSGPYVAY